MKVVAIGDIHGRTVWRDIVRKALEENADKIVFLADFLDPYPSEVISPFQSILGNFKDIVELQSTYTNKIVLLYGNHDHHYNPFVVDKQYYSRWDIQGMKELSTIIEDLVMRDRMKLFHYEDGVMYSHAGFTNTWINNNDFTLESDILQTNPDSLNYTHSMSDISMTGDSIEQSPIWVRPRSLLSDLSIEYPRQVVGHTIHEEITIVEDDVAFIDCLYYKKSYLRVIDGEYKIQSI